MKTDKVEWHGYKDYNMNCTFKDLEKHGFKCSSWNNDLAPSYMNKKENIQVFFFDLESEEMKKESINYKFSIMKLDEHREFSIDLGQTNSFDDMVLIVKNNE